MAARFCRLLPPHHHHRPLSDDRPGRGHRRFRAGGDFLQFLLKGGEIGWTLFLGSREKCNSLVFGLRVRLGKRPYRPSVWMAFGRPPAPAKSSLAADSSRTIQVGRAYRTPGKQVVAGPHDHPVSGRIEYASVRVLALEDPPAALPAGGLFLFIVWADSAILLGMADDLPKRCWFSPTPGWLVLGLLAVEGVLFLVERFYWLPKGWSVLIAIAAVAVVMLLTLLWFVIALIFRRRFQFSIRSLLVMVVAVALPCSWLAVEMKKASEQREAVGAIKKAGGGVLYDWQFDANGATNSNSEPPGPIWLRSLLGEDFFQSVRIVFLEGKHVTDAELEHLKGLGQLPELHLGGTQVTDAGLEHLRGLSNLQILLLGSTQVTDGGLEHVKGLGKLQILSLRNTQVTDAGLEHLKGLSKLQELDIFGTQITDAGLEHLAGLSQLHKLYLDNTQVTDAGLEHLKRLSELQVLWLGNTQVTDAGLEHVKGLTKLKELGLKSTAVTDAGEKNLQEALPNCGIYR